MAVIRIKKVIWFCDYCGKTTPIIEDDLKACEGWIVSDYSDHRWCCEKHYKKWRRGRHKLFSPTYISKYGDLLWDD